MNFMSHQLRKNPENIVEREKNFRKYFFKTHMRSLVTGPMHE